MRGTLTLLNSLHWSLPRIITAPLFYLLGCNMKRDDPNAVLDDWLATRQLTSDMRADVRMRILKIVTAYEAGEPVAEETYVGRKIRLHELWLASDRKKGECADFSRSQRCDGVDFSNRDLRHADFWRASLQGADFSGCDISKAQFMDADMTGAILTNAKAVEASFPNAKLVGADFTGAALHDANFSKADITDAKGISGATLKETDGFHKAWIPKELAESSELTALLARRVRIEELKYGEDCYRPCVTSEQRRYFLELRCF